MQTLGYNGYIN